MLPFFRKIRFQLARDNQFFKYSRYAIGEIVLVVVGILIALYINNWNEQRKEREKFDQVLIEVEKELVINIEEARRVLNYYHQIDSLSNIFFFDTLTVEDYRENLDFIYLGQNYDRMICEDDAYNKLLEYSDDVNDSQESAIQGLKTLYGGDRNDIMEFNTTVRNYSKEIGEYHLNFSWYSDMNRVKFNDELVEALSVDHNIKNRIEHYNMLAIGNLVYYIENFEIKARQCYKRVNSYLREKYPDHYEDTLFTYIADDYNYLVGTYIRVWDSDRGFYNDELRSVTADSTVISIEKDKLFFTPYFSDGSNSRREIIPVNNSYFRTERGVGYYQIVYDDHGNVERVDFTGSTYWLKLKKIR